MTKNSSTQSTTLPVIMTGQQALDSLPYKVPTIAPQIVALGDIPTDDFAYAFDLTFAPAKRALEQYGGNHQAATAAHEAIVDKALQGLQKFFHLTTRPFIGTMHDEGWQIELTSDGALEVSHVEHCVCCEDSYYDADKHQNIVGTLRSSGKRAVTLYQTAYEALEVITLIGLLVPIMDGSAPVWSFLPATNWQIQRAKEQRDSFRRDIRKITDRINQRADLERLFRVAREGQSDEQIRQSYIDQFEQKTGEVMVNGFRKEIRTYWTDNSDQYYPKIYLDEEYENMLQDADRRVEAAHEKRSEIAFKRQHNPEIFDRTDDEDRQEIAELEQKIDYYERSKGWPSGYVSPQFHHDDQVWLHFDASEIPGRWIEDADL